MRIIRNILYSTGKWRNHSTAQAPGGLFAMAAPFLHHGGHEVLPTLARPATPPVSLEVAGSGVQDVSGQSRECEAARPQCKGVGVEPALLATVRQMLAHGNWKLATLATNRRRATPASAVISSQTLTEAEPPFASENGSCRSLTFADRLTNDVICRWKNLDGCEIEDLCIRRGLPGR